MGCSASTVAPEGEVQANGIKDKRPYSGEKKHGANKGHQNGHIKSPQMETHKYPNKNVDKNANKLNPLAQAPVPKSVAFDVTLDGQAGDGLLAVKKRPPRLQTLEPLDIPKLTAEQLAEKQKLADQKRERMRQKKINTSQKSSRRRRELLKAREFGMKQQMEQEKTVIDDSLKQAELKREQRLLEIKEKQRLREERARRIREKAKRLQNPDDEVEVEKDTEFNAASDESWLGAADTNSQQHNNSAVGQEEFEDEEMLQKRVSQLRPTASASTVDSYDAAFMRHERQPLQPRHNQTTNVNTMDDDDFFGS